jgi:hypothetical protein
MREDMLPGKLHKFVQNAPQVTNPEVSQNERSQEPIDPMYHIVVIHLIPHMLKGELTVLIIGMHFLGHWLVELRV